MRWAQEVLERDEGEVRRRHLGAGQPPGLLLAPDERRRPLGVAHGRVPQLGLVPGLAGGHGARGREPRLLLGPGAHPGARLPAAAGRGALPVPGAAQERRAI